MFRGEPLALWTMLLGFVSFFFVQLLGIVITGVFDIRFPLTTQAHFYIAFFGWIGLTLMGAQLQFYRAITGLRKYTPNYFRYLYLLFLLSGLVLMIYGSYDKNKDLVSTGIFLYLLGAVIHSYWIFKQSGSKYFKFPLDYMFVSNLFLLVSLIILFLSSNASEYYIINRVTIRHMLSIGWISLTLQGALVRIMPMFVGQSIDRGSRPQLKLHFSFCALTSMTFSLSFALDNEILLALTGFLWFLSWVWTLNILRKSVVGKNLEYKHTLLFFVPGLLWFISGSVLGFYIVIQDNLDINTNFRALHIHLSLLLGVTLIMLGAFHRITTFQIYTLLYTGRRQESITLRSMLRLKRYALTAILFNFSVFYMVLGFLNNDFEHVGNGGIMILITTIIYSTMIFQNVMHYLLHKKDAIPFWLKSTEIDTTTE